MSAKISTTKKPLTKSTKSKTKLKGRIAGLSILNKKRKFSWKVAVLIGVVLVVGLGYLFVRLSKAAAYTWTAPMLKVESGSMATKNNRPAIQSRISSDGQNRISVFEYSSVPQGDTYCFEGYSTGEVGSWAIMAYLQGNSKAIAASSGGAIGPLASGNFTRCLYLDGNTTGIPRYINFIARSAGDKPVYVYSMYRLGPTNYPIKR